MVDTRTPQPKRSRGLWFRIVRAAFSSIDPRAYFHLLRIINYYNCQHARPRRILARAPGWTICPTVSFCNPERITMKAGVHLGPSCSIWAGEHSGRITIGENALFGPEVFVTAGNYSLDGLGEVGSQPMIEEDVTIGRNTFIGARAIILPGCTIGDGAVVGAGCIVTRDIQPGAIVVGNPARVIGHRDDSARQG